MNLLMGSRFKGYIEPQAMPALHQYFGTPVTTQILKYPLATRFTDIHCGMRGIAKDALVRIDLESQSWEYASEMCEVGLSEAADDGSARAVFERQGRPAEPYEAPADGLEPWRAGWINLRAMFLYGADFFLLRPGMVALIAGLLLTLPAALGPVAIGPVTLSLYWMMLGATLAIVGLQSVYLGAIVQVFVWVYAGVAGALAAADVLRTGRCCGVVGCCLAGVGCLARWWRNIFEWDFDYRLRLDRLIIWQCWGCCL